MSYTAFKKLHEAKELLLLGNVWDGQSSKLAEEVGYKALGLSSHPLANLYGYEDGEIIRPDEVLYMVERVKKAVKLPLSVDYEAGYSDDPNEVAQNVKGLYDAGVVGINLEDGKVVNGERKLGEASVLAEKIKAIKALTPDIFVNARADTYTTKHENALEETIKRAKIYEEAGADGLFVPLVEAKTDIKKITDSTSLYVNIFLTPNIPSKEELEEIGVTRVSHGPKVWEYLIKQNKKALEDILSSMKLP